MKRVHPVFAIIFGFFVSVILAEFIPHISIYIFLMFIVFIFGGFITTYISKKNSALLGLYEGILLVLIIFIPNILGGHLVIFNIVATIVTPISGLIGGLIAKYISGKSN